MSKQVRLLAIVSVCLQIVATSGAADFNVTTPGGQFAFNINGVNSPTLMLVRGRTYTFAVSTSPGFHPFRILNSNGAPHPNATPNNISSGTITFVVPMTAANYSYNCGVHGNSMAGTILTVPPPAPPTIRIVNFSFSSNIVLRSTGTNTFNLSPEFKTNLSTTNWFALTVQTNRFLNGTNETICGRPPGNEIFIRIRAEGN